jgi:hypothetical protein
MIPTIIFCAGRRCVTTSTSFQGMFFFFFFPQVFLLLSFIFIFSDAACFQLYFFKIWSPEILIYCYTSNIQRRHLRPFKVCFSFFFLPFKFFTLIFFLRWRLYFPGSGHPSFSSTVLKSLTCYISQMYNPIRLTHGPFDSLEVESVVAGKVVFSPNHHPDRNSHLHTPMSNAPRVTVNVTNSTFVEARRDGT